MESIFGRQMITATNQTLSIIKYPRNHLHIIRPRFQRNHLHIIRPRFQFPHGRFSVSSKLSDFQDFGSYAKASRLLPATEVRVCTESSPEKILTSLGADRDRSFYKVKLHTSSIYGSGLSDLNAGILICLIDENGNSILRRIPASSTKDYFTQSGGTTHSDELHFQRGFVDEFTFDGSKLGKFEALWIGVESGQWRLGGVSLTVIHGHQAPLEETEGNEILYSGLRYDFEVEDISLGEGSNISMTELRPCLITELSGVDPFTLLSKTSSQSVELTSHRMSNEEGMKEYADLKFSLLLYDSMLIFLGTSIANFSGGDTAAFAFLTGGVIGFLYLFLLQRSVDGLPAPTSTSLDTGDNFGQMLEGFKSPIAGLALAVGLAVVALKYGPGDVPFILTPKDLMLGMIGFLACKVAVVLAAFKPMPMGLKENK